MKAGIQWDNLWKPFVNIRRERVLLTLWEFMLWGIVWAGGVLGYYYGAVEWAVVGGIVGGGIAFLYHELFFMPFCEQVIGLTECDEGYVFGVNPSYTAPLERWGGPVA